MNEQLIISAILKDRNSWQTLKSHIDPATELSAEASTILRMASDYYSADQSAAFVSLEILKSRLEREISSNKLVKVLHDILDGLPETSSVNLTSEVLALKRHAVGLRLSSLLAAGGRTEQIEDLIGLYQQMVVGSTVHYGSDDELRPITGVPVEELFKTTLNPENLIKIYPKTLNDRLDGGARPGHHILVFAQTEMGKTLVAINMVAGFILQGKRTLYIGNEDPAADILLRVGCRVSGLNKFEIRENPGKASKIIDERCKDLFTIAPLAPGTFQQIDKLVEEYRPDVLVVDQLRNIDVRSDNRTQALEKAATEMRNLLKRRGLVGISLTQAGDSASNKRVLGRGDVDGSNVGIPGQCDVMVGVGGDEQMEANNLRMFSLPKNKLGGSHEPFTVQIDPQLSKVIDL